MGKESILELANVSLSYTSRRSFFRHEKHQALNNVTFTVKAGETFGIIGNNGSGKSTLLRVLAGIYKPDSGTITRNFSSSSLLTLGLGFSNELTGRENAIISAMLNGATKQKTYAKLDEIITFSELGKAIDNPVKTYSSGMKARLGFSVALHTNVDLLLIDEVLGVGDADFRQKAEGAMLEKINSNQTVIFVSHSADQVKKLCGNAVWLDKGQIKNVGPVEHVFSEYQANRQK